MKKLLFIVVIWILFFSQATAQDGVYLSVHQDFKHATYDEDAFRLNLLVRAKLEGKQGKIGYLVLAPTFEYADLNEHPFTRYSFDIGYSFNQLFIDKLELSAFGGWGFIQRGDSASYNSFSFIGEINYKLSKRFKLSFVSQLTERSDLRYKYGDNKWIISNFVGLEFKIL
jgi:hypothetical protein